MGIKRLYQSKYSILFALFVLSYFLLPSNKAFAYTTANCDGPDDGTASDCSLGDACTGSAPFFTCSTVRSNCYNGCSWTTCNQGAPVCIATIGNASGCTCGTVAGGAGTTCTADNECAGGFSCTACGSGGCACALSHEGEACTPGPNACSPGYSCRCGASTGCSCIDDTPDDGSDDGAGDIGFHVGEGFDLKPLVTSIYNIIFPLAIIIGVILIILGGYTFMTSQGDPKKVVEAKEKLTSAIIGLLFVLLSLGILRVLIGALVSGGNPGF